MDDLSHLVVNPIHYERMVRYLRCLNPACTSSQWAIQVLNTCIRRALSEGTMIALGMCVAVPSGLNPGNVYLFLDPVRDCELPPIHDPAPMKMPLAHHSPYPGLDVNDIF
jgi:hypothetical protein